MQYLENTDPIVSVMLVMLLVLGMWMGFSNSVSGNSHDSKSMLYSINLKSISELYIDGTIPKGASGKYTDIVDTVNPPVLKCQGIALCFKGEVVKVIDAKSFFVSANNNIFKVNLSLIGLPIVDQQAMMLATTFARNTCLGTTVLIDQDDGQKSNSLVGTAYCSPTKSINEMLLDTGYVQLDKTQCISSEFAITAWAKSHGC